MKLYHGSNVEVRKPKLLRSDRRLDFGAGFYLTSSYEQAARWAKLSAKRRKQGTPTVSTFEFDKDANTHLAVLRFDTASTEWLQFVGANRQGAPERIDLDIVIGPVANDTTMPVIRLYFANIYSEEEAIRRLLPQNLKDQYAFKTQAALDALQFCEVIDL